MLTKAPGTGGIVHRACVAEQLLYEIGDPAAYLLPDVSCDFRHVRIEQIDADRVRVGGARGRAPPPTYKVSATQLDGFRCAGMMAIVGIDAAAKAQRTGEAIVERTRGILQQMGLPRLHLGAHRAVRRRVAVRRRIRARAPAARRWCVWWSTTRRKQALEMFAREIAPAGTSWSPGTTMASGGGRPSPSPLIKPFSFLLDKAAAPASGVDRARAHGGRRAAPATPRRLAHRRRPASLRPWIDPPDEVLVEVPLVKLAFGRSGDKGNISNIGLIARTARVAAAAVAARHARGGAGATSRTW